MAERTARLNVGPEVEARLEQLVRMYAGYNQDEPTEAELARLTETQRATIVARRAFNREVLKHLRWALGREGSDGDGVG